MNTLFILLGNLKVKLNGKKNSNNNLVNCLILSLLILFQPLISENVK